MTQLVNAVEYEYSEYSPGKIKWSNNDTTLNICIDRKLNTIYIENKIHPRVADGTNFSEKYNTKIGLDHEECIRYNFLYNNFGPGELVQEGQAIIQWSIYNEKNEKINIFKTFGDTLCNNDEFKKEYYQGNGSLPTIAINIVINKLIPGKYKIERDLVYFNKNIQERDTFPSNQLTLIIHKNNNHIKPIELLKNEPIESGDNIYLGFQKETTDSLYTINWLINDKKDSTLTYKNLYQINKDYTGKLNIKLQTTTNLSGCTAYDSVELNITPRKIDTTYITKTDTIYITKTDTIYIEKESNKTAIINKQTNLNIWPNPTTTFVNAEDEEPFSYTLLNNEGKILKKEEGESSYTIDMSEYSDGVYFIKTSDGVIRKIVKK